MNRPLRDPNTSTDPKSCIQTTSEIGFPRTISTLPTSPVLQETSAVRSRTLRNMSKGSLALAPMELL